MSDTYSTGLIEVQELLLKRAKYTMTIPISTYQQTDRIVHALNVVPFFDYQFSVDGGITFVPPHVIYPSQSPFVEFVQLYIDQTYVYFNWTSSFGTTSATPLTIIIDFKLYATEATK